MHQDRATEQDAPGQGNNYIVNVTSLWTLMYVCWLVGRSVCHNQQFQFLLRTDRQGCYWSWRRT